MDMTTYIRKPFNVEAIQITEENLSEIAVLIGEESALDDGTRFIKINKKIVPHVFRAWDGWWVTKFGDDYHCYSDKLFKKQFAESTPEGQTWVEFMNREPEQPES